MEEHERRMLQEAVMGLQEGTNDHVVWKEKEDTQRSKHHICSYLLFVLLIAKYKFSSFLGDIKKQEVSCWQSLSPIS